MQVGRCITASGTKETLLASAARLVECNRTSPFGTTKIASANRSLERVLHRQLNELSQHNEVLTELLGDVKDAANRIADLTGRERQIMQRIVAGQPNKNIAAVLGISERTVEIHRPSIMKKTGSKSLPALVRLALAFAWNNVPEPESTIRIATAARPQSEPTWRKRS